MELSKMVNVLTNYDIFITSCEMYSKHKDSHVGNNKGRMD